MSEETDALRAKILACEEPLTDGPTPVGMDGVLRVGDLTACALRHPSLFRGTASMPSTTLLLFGPPGCGKTMVARALARRLDACAFYRVSASTLTSRYFGETEAGVRMLFDEAARRQAAEGRPVLLFLDEIDAVTRARGGASEDGAERRLLTELLVAWNALPPSVVVVGATNRPEDLDPAMRRRFLHRLHVPLPDHEQRAALLDAALAGVAGGHVLSAADSAALATATAGFSCDDLWKCVAAAAQSAVVDAIVAAGVDGTVEVAPLDAAALARRVEDASASVGSTASYDAWNAAFGTAPPPRRALITSICDVFLGPRPIIHLSCVYHHI